MQEAIKDARNMTVGYIDRRLNGCMLVYDQRHRLLGEIRPSGSRMIAYDHGHKQIAYWDKNSDCTYESSFKKIGKGNLLIELLLDN